MRDNRTRRQFITQMAGVGAGILGALGCHQASKSLPATTIPERVLGKTGMRLPILGLGGAGKTPLSWPNAEDKAAQLVEKALSLGIRHFDTAASYGPSEEYLGKFLPPHRRNIFLATKTAARDRDGAWRDLETSLQRLGTDYLDLWQLHHVSYKSQLEQIFSPNGAIQAIEEAKAQKLIRLAGITGHHEPAIIAEGMRRYAFDTVLIPINAADKHHPRPFLSVLPLAQEQNIGVIAMKVPAYGRLFKPGVLAGMPEALGYTMSQPGVHCCIIAAEDVAQLEANVRAAVDFQPLNPMQLKNIEARTAAVWQDNTFFRAWT
ncbi:MAG TPA: aldo/keto reductase [Oscillatoriaceae cyanobacterium M33_DOE_052]|uniref:Aldo/keto reductase n=1 Tax=Planktothricoides sp. SpSt-374 TaxID=2282167 RepID=A0A7C3VJ10_9CYAN|nr:aldo/keto reductase [Oscillatoriaceae cyanobacterium M33_DOE_052]